LAAALSPSDAPGRRSPRPRQRSPTALQATLPRIEANRNLSPAGQLRDGVLTLRLEIREGDWYPEAETGPSVVVQAFAEEGRTLQVPGPLTR
jgi:hypothetical protein